MARADARDQSPRGLEVLLTPAAAPAGASPAPLNPAGTTAQPAQPAVINGCSDLLVAVFGDRGKHARAALGLASLPRGAVVEIEMIVEVQ